VNKQANVAARGLLDLLAARQNSSPAPTSMQYVTRLTVKTGAKVAVIKTAEIDSIESAGNYVAVHTGKETHILRETLNALEKQLDPDKFLRVSRSAIINLDRVKELQPMFKGEHIIILQNGRSLAMTRGLLRELEQALKFH
jgi:two-component system LytT family response regulator